MSLHCARAQLTRFSVRRVQRAERRPCDLVLSHSLISASQNSQARLNTVIGTSIGGATIIYEVLGCLGYLTFGALVGSNVIEQYPHSTLVSICQFAIVILVLFSYPLQLHPCRASLHHLLQPKKSEETIEYREDTPVDEIPLGWFVSETAFILLTTVRPLPLPSLCTL